MLKYPHIAALTAMVHDESQGRVTLRDDGRPLIEYEIGETDRNELDRGIRACAQILFAAGARKVLVPSTPARVLDKPSQVHELKGVTRPHSMPLTSVHPMGTLCLGEDPKRSVVNSRAEHHQLKGLFVLDGSLFPTSIGVPPQLSIYTFARHLSNSVVQRLRAP